MEWTFGGRQWTLAGHWVDTCWTLAGHSLDIEWTPGGHQWTSAGQ